MYDVNGAVVDRAMVKQLTRDELVQSARVTSVNGKNHELYEGMTTPQQYSKLYSLTLIGDVMVDLANDTLHAMKSRWSKHTGTWLSLVSYIHV